HNVGSGQFGLRSDSAPGLPGRQRRRREGMMIAKRQVAGIHTRPGETPRVEIRLMVLAIILLLLALMPSVVGAQQVVRLSLEEAVGRALGGSEVVEVAEAGLLRARGDRFQARSGFFPTVSGTLGYSRTLSSE